MARRPNNLAVIQGVKNAARSIRSVQQDETDEEAREDAEMPVTPLGKHDKTCYYLDSSRQLIELAHKDHSRLGLQGLVGRHYEWLRTAAPRADKDGRVTGWRPELIAELLIAACDAKGIWDPDKRERGRGAWRGEGGELVLHVGDRVMSFPPLPDAWEARTDVRPGMIGRHVYPAGEATARPAVAHAIAGDGGPADKLLELLSTWSWRRGEIDAVLLLGWLGAAMIGGALDWRPMMWLTGGKGTGKSTLQKLINLVLDESLVAVVDTSGAGIWQALRRQTLPVAVDELEAAEDNRKALSVVELARAAASGGRMRRGTADHKGVEFTVRSCFLFSSILMPPLLGQDLSRLAILELGGLRPGLEPPRLDAGAMRLLGAQLRRRLVDGWHRFETTLAHYRASLDALGHSPRGQDQFGVLLTCADILLHDGAVDSDTSGAWTRRLEADKLAETDEDARDEDRCLAHMMSYSVDLFRNGERRTVAEWVQLAAGMSDNAPQADKVLGTLGMRVVLEGGQRYLAVANFHNGTAGIFANTHWAGRSGTMGVYVQALRRLPGASRTTKPIWFGGVPARGVQLPLDVVAPRDPSPRELELEGRG